MIDAKRLLDQFLGAGAGQGSGLSGVLGGGTGRQSGGGGILDNVQRQARENPLAASVIAGGLAAVLLGSKGKGLTGSAVKLGGLGLIGGLAYRAYQDWQAKQAGQAIPQNAPKQIAPPPADTPFAPGGNAADERARLLLTAMIAAAKADGHIDAAEQQRIFDKLGALELDSESKAYLMDQLRTPLDLDGIVRQAGSPEVATEVYAASLLAIDPDHPAEKAYLQMLAARLGLADELVQQIHSTADAARVPA
jgi:uncharacterized membrane protein YebE (DUF533 family)